MIFSLYSIRAGDCLLGVDDTDLLGLKIKDIATLIRNEKGVQDLNFFIWRCMHQEEDQNDTGLALKGPLPNVARNLANALSGTVRMHSITQISQIVLFFFMENKIHLFSSRFIIQKYNPELIPIIGLLSLTIQLLI